MASIYYNKLDNTLQGEIVVGFKHYLCVGKHQAHPKLGRQQLSWFHFFLEQLTLRHVD